MLDDIPTTETEDPCLPSRCHGRAGERCHSSQVPHCHRQLDQLRGGRVVVHQTADLLSVLGHPT